MGSGDLRTRNLSVHPVGMDPWVRLEDVAALPPVSLLPAGLSSAARESHVNATPPHFARRSEVSREGQHQLAERAGLSYHPAHARAVPPGGAVQPRSDSSSAVSPSLRTHRGGGGENAAAERRGDAVRSSSTVLFEMLVPIFSKLQDREEVRRQLGVWVTTGYGGANGLSRVVTVRLTDPADPFFLFDMELLEDEYGAFKQRLELLVDFNGFPKYLVSMLAGVVSCAAPYLVSFVVDREDSNQGTLRVLEKTEFRTVEHVSLQMKRQGDVGQKRYLAERFQHFEQAYLQSEAARRDERTRSETETVELRHRLRAVEEENAALEDKLKLTASMANTDKLGVVSQLKEDHANAMEALRARIEAELLSATRKLEDAQRQYAEDMRQREKTVEELRQKCTAAESSLISMTSQLRLSQETVAAQTKELQEVRATNADLVAFREHANRTISQNELSFVATSERLRSATESLQAKETEVAALKQQNDKLDGYIRMLSVETSALRAKLEESEQSQKKAHHIISKQLQRIQTSKEKERILQARLSSQDKLVDEKSRAAERLHADLATATERYEMLLQKANDLREQLGKTDEERVKLVNELKQSQEALVHLQRNTSVGGRHWGSLSTSASSAGIPRFTFTGSIPAPVAAAVGGYPLPSSSPAPISTSTAYPTFDVYREFARNTSVLSDGRPSARGAPATAAGLPATASHPVGTDRAAPVSGSGLSALEESGAAARDSVPTSSLPLHTQPAPHEADAANDGPVAQDGDGTVNSKLLSVPSSSSKAATPTPLTGGRGADGSMGYRPSAYATSLVRPSQEAPLFAQRATVAYSSAAATNPLVGRGYDVQAAANSSPSAYFKRP